VVFLLKLGVIGIGWWNTSPPLFSSFFKEEEATVNDDVEADFANNKDFKDVCDESEEIYPTLGVVGGVFCTGEEKAEEKEVVRDVEEGDGAIDKGEEMGVVRGENAGFTTEGV
jgi:hypothetical protein